MTDKAHIDFETRSAVDLTKVGVHKYVEHPTTDMWLFSWKIGNGFVRRWHPGDPAPIELLEHIVLGGRVVSHGAMFERTIWNQVLTVDHEPTWPKLRIEQQECTQGKAQMMSYPRELDDLAFITKMTERKDKDGAALMKKMMRPRSMKDGDIVWWDEPENVARLGSYCDQDVITEEEADSILWDLPPEERLIWELDQRINDRGIKIDVAAISRAMDIGELGKARGQQRMKQITKCAKFPTGVTPTQIAKIKEFLADRGIVTVSLDKQHAEELLVAAHVQSDPISREVIELRRLYSKNSNAKYKTMLECVCDNGRVKGQFNYHGARRTGRWAGQLVQFQNLPRFDYEKYGPQLLWMLGVLHGSYTISATYDLLECGLGKPLDWTSKAIRSMIIADVDHRLIGGDFSNIEGRVNAWLAGETWKLQAFAAYDRKEGPDLYNITASDLLGLAGPHAVSNAQRQSHGKVPELALGYQGGVNAFITMGATYGVEPQDIYEAVISTVDPDRWAIVSDLYDHARDKCGLPQEHWTAIKIVVQGWRAKNPAIVMGWWEIQDAAIAAIQNPGTVWAVYGGKARYWWRDGWLFCVLPSGRQIMYAGAHLRGEDTELIEFRDRWVETTEFLPWEIDDLIRAGAKMKMRHRKRVWFYGVDAETKQWQEMYLYGGTQCENIVSATARDFLATAMLRADHAGYPIILHAHDEIVTECRYGFGSKEELRSIMAEHPRWPHAMSDLPIAVKTWEDTRYVK